MKVLGGGFGWVEYSGAALRRLRSELEAKGQGVVDEMGVLAIHSGYADYFFPGTSVLQTRPRYLFFACWNLLWLASQRGVDRSNIKKRKDDAELWVTERLVARHDRLGLEGEDTARSGIIGIRVFREQSPRVPAQTIDFVYWTALRRWGFYASHLAEDRGRLLRLWRGASIVRAEDANDASGDDVIDDEALAFLNVPPVPEGWQSEALDELSFEMSRSEALMLQERLMAVSVGVGTCLLAKAAELSAEDANPGQSLSDRPWLDPTIVRAAELSAQLERLERARKASALVHYVRAVYAALVEWTVEQTTSRPNPQRAYREHLRALVADGVRLQAAISLELSALYFDVPRVPEILRKCLSQVQAGLQRVAAGEPAEAVFMTDAVHQAFELVERRRKGARARLPRTEHGAGRRVGFSPNTIGVYDLDYRWAVVRDLLNDLRRGLARR